jgi:hypothetical protein
MCPNQTHMTSESSISQTAGSLSASALRRRAATSCAAGLEGSNSLEKRPSFGRLQVLFLIQTFQNGSTKFDDIQFIRSLLNAQLCRISLAFPRENLLHGTKTHSLSLRTIALLRQIIFLDKLFLKKLLSFLFETNAFLEI